MVRRNLRSGLLVQTFILLLLIPAIIIIGRPNNDANTASTSLAVNDLTTYPDANKNNISTKRNRGIDDYKEDLGFPTEGPGGPILVVSSESNPFSRYPVEILRAEGLNAFTALDISAVSPALLDKYDVVILGEMKVMDSQVKMFTEWVNKGGTFITFRPSSLFNSLLGLSNSSGTISDKYLLVNTESGPGTGIVKESIQFHGPADLRLLNGATALATLYSSASEATIYPAVTSFNTGNNGGKAFAFTYDLARSIVYTRQGNPLWAGQKRDGQINPIRSDDLFYPNWIDFNKVAIPQADEQQRLLANIIIQGNLHRKPLPRFWYLPRDLKAVIVMTGDNHSDNGTAVRFSQYYSLGPNTAQDVADWKAIRATSYIYPGRPINYAQAMFFQEQGFEISLHTNTGCFDYSYSSLQRDFTDQLNKFGSSYPEVLKPVTNRSHCLNWSDWSSTPKVEAQNGIRLDATYYYWPQSWMKNRPGMFTGSGMPMRFADKDGTLIDVYQMPTQMTDETNMDYSTFCNTILDKAIGQEGYYGVFCANMHTDKNPSIGADQIIASAQARQIPVISARQILTWLDSRNNSSFGNIKWENSKLTFSVTEQSSAHNLKAMLPMNSESGKLTSITLQGTAIPFSVQTIKGIAYAFFAPLTGTNTYIASYNTRKKPMADRPVIAGTAVPTLEKLYVNVMPNPTIKYFNLVMNSEDPATVSLKVSDMSGRIIESHDKMQPTGILQMGHDWKAGTYFAEVIQGNQRKVVKLIKVN